MITVHADGETAGDLMSGSGPSFLLVQSLQIRLRKWALTNWMDDSWNCCHQPRGPRQHSTQDCPHWYLRPSGELSAGSSKPLGPGWLWVPKGFQAGVHTGSPAHACRHGDAHLTFYTVDSLHPTYPIAEECNCVVVDVVFFHFFLFFCYLHIRFSGSVSLLSYLYPEGFYLFVFFAPCLEIWFLCALGH